MCVKVALAFKCRLKTYMKVKRIYGCCFFFWPREAPATCTVHLHLQATLKQMYEHQRRHQKRGPRPEKTRETACLFLCLSCLALVVVFVSSVFCSTDSEKRERDSLQSTSSFPKPSVCLAKGISSALSGVSGYMCAVYENMFYPCAS